MPNLLYISVIAHTRPNDVLLGRGRSSTRQQGNALFRQLVNKHADQYNGTDSRHVKASIIASVVKTITETHHGRFLEELPDNRGWLEISHKSACVKTGQALRYKHRCLSSKDISTAVPENPDSDANSTKKDKAYSRKSQPDTAIESQREFETRNTDDTDNTQNQKRGEGDIAIAELTLPVKIKAKKCENPSTLLSKTDQSSVLQIDSVATLVCQSQFCDQRVSHLQQCKWLRQSSGLFQTKITTPSNTGTASPALYNNKDRDRQGEPKDAPPLTWNRDNFNELSHAYSNTGNAVDHPKVERIDKKGHFLGSETASSLLLLASNSAKALAPFYYQQQDARVVVRNALKVSDQFCIFDDHALDGINSAPDYDLDDMSDMGDTSC